MLRTLITAFVFMCVPAFADAPKLPPGVTCEFVRAKVAEHGKYVAWAWAKLHGYSRAEIEIAKRCLR
jgi:hypothetical protein